MNQQLEFRGNKKPITTSRKKIYHKYWFVLQNANHHIYGFIQRGCPLQCFQHNHQTSMTTTPKAIMIKHLRSSFCLEKRVINSK